MLKRECFSRITDNISCRGCNENKTKRLLLHHIRYNKNSVVYNKFENSDDGRLKYHVNLLDEINQDPSNFIICCFTCHQLLERMISKYPTYSVENQISCYCDLHEMTIYYLEITQMWAITVEKRNRSNDLDEFFWS